MVTTDNTNHPITFKGLSTDTKPVLKWGDIDLRNGDQFLEMDSGDVYFYNGDNNSWIQPS